MTVKLLKKENGCVVILGGRLDTNVAAEAEKMLCGFAADYPEMTLDIADLQYISSSGLRIILKLHVSLNKSGGQLFIKNTTPQVMEVFEMVGFTTFLNFI